MDDGPLRVRKALEAAARPLSLHQVPFCSNSLMFLFWVSLLRHICALAAGGFAGRIGKRSGAPPATRCAIRNYISLHGPTSRGFRWWQRGNFARSFAKVAGFSVVQWRTLLGQNCAFRQRIRDNFILQGATVHQVQRGHIISAGSTAGVYSSRIYNEPCEIATV